MTITTTAHLNFRGDARAALELYHSVFGGRIVLATYADMGMPQDAPGAQGIVFGSVESEAGFRIAGYDVPGETAGGPAGGAAATRRENGVTITTASVFVAVRGETLAEIEGCWAALAEGGDIVEPLAASAWSPGFGMLTDRFGVTWVLDVAVPYEAS